MSIKLTQESEKKLSGIIDAAKSAWKLLTEFHSGLSRLISDKFPNTETKWEKNRENTEKIFTDFPKNPPKTIQSVINLYGIYDEILLLLREQYEIITDGELLDMYFAGMSQTFVSEAGRKTQVIEKLIQYLSSNINGDESYNLMKQIFSAVYSAIKPEELTKLLLSHTNTFTIFSIKEMIKLFPEKNRKLMKKIEEMKDDSLSVPPNIIIEEGILTNRLIIRWGLIPMGTFSPIEHVFECIREKYDENFGTEDNFKKLLKKYNIMLMMMSRGRYIEYNFLPLISNNYVIRNDMNVTRNSGLSENMIRKFRTLNIIEDNPGETDRPDRIIYIPRGSEVNSDFDITGGTPNDADKTIILQCLNKKYFRIMTRKIDNYVVNGCGNSSEQFAGDTAEQICSGLSLRPHQYNKVMENIIFDKCINKNHRKIMLGFIESKSTQPSASVLKANIMTASVNTFSDIYSEKKPTNISDLSKILADIDPIINTLNYILINHFGIKDNLETKISFVRYLDSVSELFENKYRTEINDLFSSKKLNRNIYENYNDREAFTQIRGIYQSMIEKIVNEMDNKPSIWEEFILTLKEYSEL